MDQPIIVNVTSTPASRLGRFEREINELTAIYLNDVSLLHYLHMPDFVVDNAGDSFDRVMEDIARKYPDVINWLDSHVGNYIV